MRPVQVILSVLVVMCMIGAAFCFVMAARAHARADKAFEEMMERIQRGRVEFDKLSKRL